MYLTNLENIMNLLNQCVLSTSHESIIKVAIFSQCVSLIEFNPGVGSMPYYHKCFTRRKNQKKICKKSKVVKKEE
jgi:hypothetical protein